MIKAIGDNILELSFVSLLLVVIVGFGWMINRGENRYQERYHACIESGMQYISGSCVR